MDRICAGSPAEFDHHKRKINHVPEGIDALNFANFGLNLTT
jgi:hypothetical protein